MHIGGVQKALTNLLWNIHNEYEISLLLFYPEGEYIDQIPPGVKIIKAGGNYQYLAMHRRDAITVGERIMRSFYAAITQVLGRKFAIALMKTGQKPLDGYDVAISYLHNGSDKFFYGGCNDFLLKHVSAKKRIAMLHCDYILSGANTADNNRQYAQFDTIAACSQGCAEAFVKANPHMTDKVTVVPNCHRFDRIQAMAAEAAVSLDPEKINIVIVSRLGKEKSVDRALRAMASLGDLKKRIHYYIVGDGSQKPKLMEVIEKENLQPYVTLCGQLDNPYGYMRAADLLLIPSRSEAAPLVIEEAACLGTPVLSTKTSSAEEMILETGLGWVCENNEAAMTDALRKLIREPDLLRERSRELKGREFTDGKAVARFQECLK